MKKTVLSALALSIAVLASLTSCTSTKATKDIPDYHLQLGDG